MFTGIVQGTARVEHARDADGLRRLRLRFPEGALNAVQVGASIAVGGVCLTVVHHDAPVADFDVIDETLRLTTLGDLQDGDAVNFERSATFGTEIGGHVLSGHVSGMAEVVERTEDAGNLTIWFRPPPALLAYILPKGFVSLDGCSLTIGTVRDGAFSVHLIPETRRVTTMDALQVGSRANVEVDAMTQAVVATVERVLAARGE